LLYIGYQIHPKTQAFQPVFELYRPFKAKKARFGLRFQAKAQKLALFFQVAILRLYTEL